MWPFAQFSRRALTFAILASFFPVAHAAERIPVLLLLGPPGSGKSTQSKMLEEEFGYRPISTGALLRDEVAKGTELGRQVESTMKAGKLVEDEIVNRLLTARLLAPESQKGVLLDGYPRTKSQARFLEGWLKTHGFAKPVILHLDVPDQVVMERLLKRGRADDTEASIAARLKRYHEETAPVLSYFRRNRTYRIDGAQSPEAVSASIRQALARAQAA